MHMRKINLNKDKELKIIAKELKKLHSKKTYEILAKDFFRTESKLKK